MLLTQELRARDGDPVLISVGGYRERAMELSVVRWRAKSICPREVVGLALTQDVARGLIFLDLFLDLISIGIGDGQGPIAEDKELRNVGGVKRQDAILTV